MMINLFDTFVGVVAFIEARSNTENRFEGISKQMEMLGATVSHILQIQKLQQPGIRLQQEPVMGSWTRHNNKTVRTIWVNFVFSCLIKKQLVLASFQHLLPTHSLISLPLIAVFKFRFCSNSLLVHTPVHM